MTDKAEPIERLQPMTLIERLTNPQWITNSDPFGPPLLDPNQTLKDMREAAAVLAINTAIMERGKEALRWIAGVSIRYHKADRGFIISGIEQYALSTLKELEKEPSK